MTHSYHELVSDSIYFGGAKDVKEMVDNEGIQVIVDLREEAEECAYSQDSLQWIKIPLGDNASEPQPELFKQAIKQVVKAHSEGKKVAFHCGGGKGRTGAVAIGALLELGLAKTLKEAEEMVKNIRPIIAVKPAQWEALRYIYSR
jgi:protein-tyrosine phosphatase